MGTCSTLVLQDLFTRESGRIVPTIEKRMVGKNIMIDKIERGPFPDGMGYILNTMTVERSFTNTADDAVWTPITPSTGSGNAACLPAVNLLTTGQTLRQFQLVREAIESPDICLEDLRTDFQLSQQLGITVEMFGNGIRWELEKQSLNAYLSNSNYLVNANSNFQNYLTTPIGANPQTGTVGTGIPLWDKQYPPTSGLTQGMLDQVYMNLYRDSFGDGMAGLSDGVPTYALLTAPETSRSLIKDNPDIRNDFRWAWDGMEHKAELMRPYGVSRSYGNFVHVPYAQMPRYDFVNNAWVRRSYWDTTPTTTKGVAPVVSALYLAAQYETSIIFNPKVFRWLVPGSLDAPGGTTRFSTPNYFPATVTWKNIPERNCNPDETIGFFRAVLAMAAQPLHPEYGYCILHKRCAPLLNETNCAAS